MNISRKNRIEANEISQIETFTLGGYAQKVMIEGRRADAPIVVALHGGPGMPIPFNVGCRGLFPEFTDRCILVCWDQYGCGINNAEVSDDFTINDFVNMTIDLVKILKKRFPKNRLYLFGMSWGSVLSAKTAESVPELLSGVITYGQVLTKLMCSDETRQAILTSKAPEKVKNETEIIIEKGNMTFSDCMKMSKYIRKYTEGYNNASEPQSPIGSLIKELLTGPDYKVRDVIAIMKNGYMKNHSLIMALSKIDLRHTLQNISVPYHIIQGDTDVVTPTNMILEFLKSCDNPNLSCQVVKDAAHMAGMNGMEAIMNEINNLG